MQAIESDAQLAGIMARHAQWVIPQQIIHDLRSVAEWNRQHPTMPKTLIGRQRDWHFLTSTATPTFHFFRDGKLVATLSGWPGAAQKDALRAELDRVGLSVSK